MKVQCKACPWKKGVRPAQDIPGGYCERKHAALADTIAPPGEFRMGGVLRVMACHESPVGKERACVGWAVSQMGPGNNIALRLYAARTKAFDGLETVGPQHATFEDTLP